MRFDDSLTTVLSVDMTTDVGARSAWRQLIDLMSRGRIAADPPTLDRLRTLRADVPLDIRTASARAVAFATPGAALVGLLAEDELSVAAPVLRTAVLPASDWLVILSRLSPQGRSILRHRRDLPGEVVRGLESFGTTDFVLGDDTPRSDHSNVVEAAPTVSTPAPPTPAPTPTPAPDTPRSATPFVSLGDVARGIPVVAEALRRVEPDEPHAPVAASGFQIVDLVQRIDAFTRTREADATDREDAPSAATTPATSFRYEADREGTVRWVDGVARGALIGVSLAQPGTRGLVGIDAIPGGALRKRARFADARLEVGGTSDAAGSWRLSGEPLFDFATGRFTGFRGIARRAFIDPSAATKASADSLRQLVHELRTPTNAIAGFAELIESQLLGPVDPGYRGHATTIRQQAGSLIAAIDDLDTAARIEGRALDIRITAQSLQPLVTSVARDLAPLAAGRDAAIRIDDLAGVTVDVDDRLAERLVSRLLAALVTASGAGETITVTLAAVDQGMVTLSFSRPASFLDRDEASLLRIDADAAVEGEGAPLLGIGFALRLARNLAAELGGALEIAADRLTLRLPTAVDDRVERTAT